LDVTDTDAILLNSQPDSLSFPGHLIAINFLLVALSSSSPFPFFHTDPAS
jgi:hypothetical protein